MKKINSMADEHTVFTPFSIQFAFLSQVSPTLPKTSSLITFSLTSPCFDKYTDIIPLVSWPPLKNIHKMSRVHSVHDLVPISYGGSSGWERWCGVVCWVIWCQSQLKSGHCWVIMASCKAHPCYSDAVQIIGYNSLEVFRCKQIHNFKWILFWCCFW